MSAAPDAAAAAVADGAADNNAGEGAVWSPEGMSQEDFLMKDECILVNFMDEVIGHGNKYSSHTFSPAQPKAILHRAFSVMLFDSDERLLLQQRSAAKITFPNVWTNTCCSHPLHGMRPSEVDGPAAVAAGDPIGVKHAAVRKLKHELGIPLGELKPERFKFMTRVHYWAADTLTYGADAPWGEHEIDHLLLYQLAPGEVLTLLPDPEEVQAVRWVSCEELRVAMGGGEDALAKEMPLWSPWFKIISERFLEAWWADLAEALAGGKYVDTSGIHRFDTPAHHHGGAGGATPSLDALAAAEREALERGGEEERRRVVAAAAAAEGSGCGQGAAA